MHYRSIPLRKFDHYARRRGVLLGLIAFALLAIGAQLGNLTIVEHDRLLVKAQNNLYSQKRLAFPRGNVLDRQGRILATNRRTYSVTFSPYGIRDAQAGSVLHSIRDLAGSPDAASVERILQTRPRWTRHVVVEGAELVTILPIVERPQDFPGARVDAETTREYAAPADFAHVIGYTGKIQPSEVADFNRPRYLPNDRVGRAGLERVFEQSLAGHPGRERQRRDARGHRLDDPELMQASKPGENLYLTLDATLQHTAMELLAGETGSIIVMDVNTGGLLILASRPTFDPNNPSTQEFDGHPAGYLNLALRGLYPPGSTIKIAGAAAIMAEGIDPKRQVMCRGSFTLPGWNRPFHCANRYGHGAVDLCNSIKESCNSYYFVIGNELGAQPLFQMARAFGFGEKTGIDLPGEAAGQLAAMENPPAGETTNLWIGQGTMLATPLQVARAYAGLATRSLPTPHVVRAVGWEESSARAMEHPARTLPLSQQHAEIIIEGLARAVNSQGGTAYKAGIPARWGVVGKTGTAETASGKDDAWFAGFFPRSQPRYSFVVHIESTDGHGGDIAAPIARKLIAGILGEPEPERTVASNE